MAHGYGLRRNMAAPWYIYSLRQRQNIIGNDNDESEDDLLLKQ
jgi:hypothetical protein